MLVVNRVELILRHEPHQMGELQRDHPAWGEHDFHSGDEVVDVGHLREHVVADEQVGLPSLGDERARGLAPEELEERRHPSGNGGLGDIHGGLDPERRNAACHEVLEQIAVVARDLDHMAGAG